MDNRAPFPDFHAAGDLPLASYADRWNANWTYYFNQAYLRNGGNATAAAGEASYRTNLTMGGLDASGGAASGRLGYAVGPQTGSPSGPFVGPVPGAGVASPGVNPYPQGAPAVLPPAPGKAASVAATLQDPLPGSAVTPQHAFASPLGNVPFVTQPGPLPTAGLRRVDQGEDGAGLAGLAAAGQAPDFTTFVRNLLTGWR